MARLPNVLRHRSRHTVEMDTGKDWSEMKKQIIRNADDDTFGKKKYFGDENIRLTKENAKLLTDIDFRDGLLAQMANETGEKIKSLTASLDAWKKLAELLIIHWRVTEGDAGYDYCIHCHQSTFLNPGKPVTHSPDCPIEQLRKLKEGEGK